jgi:hypothetical protein
MGIGLRGIDRTMLCLDLAPLIKGECRDAAVSAGTVKEA